MSKVDTDVRTMANNIGYIYSYAYKKFFQIIPERYINVDDMMKDLYHKIPLWDSHAGVSLKRSHIDTTAHTINSKGNGYLYVSHNAKIDNIYRIYREFMEKGAKTITVNLSAFSRNDDTYIVYSLLGPLLNADVEIKTADPGNSRLGEQLEQKYRDKFKYECETMILKYLDMYSKEDKTMKIPFQVTGVKINIIVQDLENVEILFRSNKDTTIYTYVDKGAPRSIIPIRSVGSNVAVYIKTVPLIFVTEKRLKLKIGSIGEKYYPTS